MILGSGEEQDGAEGGHVLQQGEEGAFHSLAHSLPPLRNMWHEHHARCAAAGLAENLQANTDTWGQGELLRVGVTLAGWCVLPEHRTPLASSH